MELSKHTYLVTELFYGVRDNHDSQIQIIYVIAFCFLFHLTTLVWAFNKEET